MRCLFPLSIIKVIKKPPTWPYPKEINSLGDHLRTKRLDLNLKQKHLAKVLNVCEATIVHWEKNHFEPQCSYIPSICDFLHYCPIVGSKVEHFGHQLRNFRIFTLGQTIFDLANDIGIDECTLSEIEETNTIKHSHVLNAINLFLKKTNWQIPDDTKAQFIPHRSKCIHTPKYMTIIGEPKTLGNHIALRRKQLKLTQLETMQMISVKSPSAFGCWERNTSTIHIKYYPAIMRFLNYCPIRYSKNEGEQLKLFREHLGLSYRQIDKILNLSKGCTYRIEKVVQKDPG